MKDTSQDPNKCLNPYVHTLYLKIKYNIQITYNRKLKKKTLIKKNSRTGERMLTALAQEPS